MSRDADGAVAPELTTFFCRAKTALTLLIVTVLFLIGVLGEPAGIPFSYLLMAQDNPFLNISGNIVGVDYGPFRDGQDPNKGIFPTAEQLKEDMPVLKNIADAIRTYSATNGLENIVSFAAEEGLKVAPGAWLSDDPTANEKETDNLINLAQQYDNILFAVVGSEAILRWEKGWPQGLPKEKVIEQINRVKQKVSVPVTTAEPWHIWTNENNKDVAEAVDLILVNIH